MTATAIRSHTRQAAVREGRFRLHRAGILNVWQYDAQVFTFADGRLLLRGANGAGKSKTLEMLLPFAIDGDKSRITASAKHHTSLLWLMTDGIDAGNRVGYVWVEFRRPTGEGTTEHQEESFTCGVGIRASTTGRTASAWYFATDRRVGVDLALEDEAGPLSMPRLKELLGAEHVFEKAADYKAHIGRVLFGLDAGQYDEVLRLLYWLRQPQVGEDIEPVKLGHQLSQALPQLDDQAVRTAGDTFDELTAVGEQLDRRAAAAEALSALAGAYAAYARSVVAERARAVTAVIREERRLRFALRDADARAAEVTTSLEAARETQRQAEREKDAAGARLRALEDSPEFRDQRRLDELARIADHDALLAADGQSRCTREEQGLARLTGRVQSTASETRRGLDDVGTRSHDLDARLRSLVPGADMSLAATAAGLRTVDLPPIASPTDGELVADSATPIHRLLERLRGALAEAVSAVTGRRAAVTVVRGALAEAEQAISRQRAAETEAERAQARWEEARDARIAAEQDATEEHDRLAAALAEWAGDAEAPMADSGVAPPTDLTADVVTALPAWARDAAAARLGDLRSDQARWHATITAARSELARLRTERAAVAAEHDPAPPPPALPRTPRPDGHPLWQAVDFVPGFPAEEQAAIEAALQSSGLLDAWVRPGGRLLGPDERDVALAAAGQRTAYGSRSATLGDVLVADVPDGGGLATDDVERVLAGIGLGPSPGDPAWVTREGAWQLGTAHGRAAKERAQFIGATARAAERSRRVGLLDAAIAGQEGNERDAQAREKDAGRAIAALEQWVARVPSGQPLLRALTLVDERGRLEAREQERDHVAQAAAHQARALAAGARETLGRLALEHRLPSEAGPLAAVEEELRSLVEGLRDAQRAEQYPRRSLELWVDAVADHSAGAAGLEAERHAAREADLRAEASRAQFEALRASVGDSVEELQRRIGATRTAQQAHARAAETAAAEAARLNRAAGAAEADTVAAAARLAGHEEAHEAAIIEVVAAAKVPGLFDAAGADGEAARAAGRLADHSWGEPVPRPIASVVAQVGELTHDEPSSASTRLWRAHTEAVSGPAADHQPTVAEFGDLLAVTGRDDGGEAVVVRLVERVRAGVERDRDLLTEREKQQFEQHILGELGDAIRRCRREAEELVAAMNEQLGHVTTSQGIRTRLDWKLREDVPPEARSAVELLAQPVGALLPEERAALRDALHQLIEASRAQRPELSYAEHLAAALDYRTWSSFTIRYTRPETPGRWERLHRRSPLSQGEQKVLCYLPLFAAAAAHFTSLAGAAAHAPRLVLLDDAFPKIDVRTHPLLFGLLVDLDLDFVITSERLWGDHASVPSLAIYEALRDPNQRGIAHIAYRWDGRMLESVG